MKEANFLVQEIEQGKDWINFFPVNTKTFPVPIYKNLSWKIWSLLMGEAEKLIIKLKGMI